MVPSFYRMETPGPFPLSIPRSGSFFLLLDLVRPQGLCGFGFYALFVLIVARLKDKDLAWQISTDVGSGPSV